LRAVVVHPEAAAEVEVAHRRPLLLERHVVAAGLEHPVANVADVRDLRAEVVMQQMQAVEQLVLAQRVDQLDDLRRRKTKDAAGPRSTRSSAPRPCWRA